MIKVVKPNAIFCVFCPEQIANLNVMSIIMRLFKWGVKQFETAATENHNENHINT